MRQRTKEYTLIELIQTQDKYGKPIKKELIVGSIEGILNYAIQPRYRNPTIEGYHKEIFELITEFKDFKSGSAYKIADGTDMYDIVGINTIPKMAILSMSRVEDNGNI